MFQWLNKRDVESDEGFAFKCAHRFYYHYIERERVLKVLVEPIKNGLELILESHPKWDAPHEGEPISDDKLAVIERRICEALKFMGIRYKIRRR